MADEPLAGFGGKTPLQMAEKPHIDWMAKYGQTGRLITVPETMHPGSEIANMAVLGYDVEKVYDGRGVLEAASMGVELQPGDLALRCNLLTIEKGILENHSAGHISSEEAAELIDFLNEKLGTSEVKFYPGVSYRHLLVVKNGNKELKCTPPHDVPGTPFKNVLINAKTNEASETTELLNGLILKSQELLENHPVNQKRKKTGKAVSSLEVPVTKGTSGILMFPDKEASRKPILNCIRCGRCASACPMGLEPYLLGALSDQKRYEDCEKERIMDCMECGSCHYICPSGRPLLDQMRVGKTRVGNMIRKRSQH